MVARDLSYMEPQNNPGLRGWCRGHTPMLVGYKVRQEIFDRLNKKTIAKG